MKVRCGIDRLLASPESILGQRLGFLGHSASVLATLQPSWEALAASRRWSLVRLFGPEHGLDGAAQDMEGVDSARDPLTGLPVISLYGRDEESLAPRVEDLVDLDAIVVDLVDVGSRYYTYLATLGMLLRNAALARTRVVVCDRPNPLGGDRIEGPGLAPSVRSFVGLFPMPVVHGLTPAEFARHIVRTEHLDVELETIAVEGWNRDHSWHQTGLPFLPPSPNMPHPITALVYPGGCLIEATNLSEGRGTTRPFEQIGAPFVDPERLIAATGALPGATLRPVRFRPTFQKWAGQTCSGIFLHVTNPTVFRPLETGCRLLAAFSREPGFGWRDEPYEFRTDHPAIDLLTGSAELRERLESGEGLDAWIDSWSSAENAWREHRRPDLLYPEADQGSSLDLVAAAPAVAIVGRKNVGKTTLVEELIRTLDDAGLRVGSIKHTHHPVPLDDPGKDSTRHALAGAAITVLLTGEGCRVHVHRSVDLTEVLKRYFPADEFDLVLVEGLKTSSLPRLELLRAGVSREPICPDAALTIADFSVQADGRPVIAREDVAAIAAACRAHAFSR